ncbi:MAG: hypothetical protein HY859_02450 [Caulobacterales bacterium]|nr:hypothetical protein [Caulobacterales bacterium]
MNAMGFGTFLRCCLIVLMAGGLHAAVSFDEFGVTPFEIREDSPASPFLVTGITYPIGGRVVVTAAFDVTGFGDPPLQAPVVEHDGVSSTARVILTPLPSAAGWTILTVTVAIDDGTAGGGADRVSHQALIRVTAVNDAPTIDQPVEISIDEDHGAFDILVHGLSPGPPEESYQNISLRAVPTQPSLIAVTGIDYVQGSPDATIHVTTLPDAHGVVSVIIVVSDNGGTYDGGENANVRFAQVIIAPVNDPPVLAVHRDLPVSLGGLATITTAHLRLTDVDNPSSATLVFTLVATPPGTLKRHSTTLVTGGSFTQADIEAGDITYRHSGGATDTITFTYGDGIAAAQGPGTLLVTPSGLGRPEIHLAALAPLWSEDGPATTIAPTGTITDPDSTSVNGGFLSIDIPIGFVSGDVLTVADQGMGAGQVSLSHQIVYVSGSYPVGYFSGGDAGTPLVITFSGTYATLDRMTAVLRAVQFAHVGDDPGSTSRILRVVASDGTAESSDPVTTTVAVIPVDDPPVLAAPWMATTAGVARDIRLAAVDPDSTTLTWSIISQPAAGVLTIVDPAAGIFHLQPGAIGSTSAQIAVADTTSITVATLAILVTDGDSPQPLPASDPPREAFIGIRLDADLVFDVSSLTAPGALTFALTGSPPAGLEVSALGPTSARLTWPAPAGTGGALLAFGILAIDPVSRAAGLLPVLLRLHPQPRAAQ